MVCASAEAGDLKVAKLVLEHGADVNKVDDQGRTPLDYCTGIAHTWQFKSGQDYPKVAGFLRDHGAVHGTDLNANE